MNFNVDVFVICNCYATLVLKLSIVEQNVFKYLKVCISKVAVFIILKFNYKKNS